MKWFIRGLAGMFLAAMVMTLSTSYQPAHAQDAALTPAGVTRVPDRLIVRYKSGPSVLTAAASTLDSLDAVQVVDVLEGMRLQILQVPPARLDKIYAQLQRDPNVESVAYDIVTVPAGVPNDPALASGEQWAPQRIQAPEAWEITRGEGIIIAVVDSGVDPNHPDLRDRLVPGYNFYDFNTDTSDGCGHGTHVAGIAAATGNNGEGIAGIAHAARIMPVKVMAANCSGSYSRLIQGIYYAVDNGARVIVISSGATMDSSYLRDALIYARERGAVVAAAAGNYNSDAPFYPAAYPEAICVAGTDTNDNRMSVSNYGSHVDIAAPGSPIYSTYWSSTSGSTYIKMGGTSMAAPHVAGVAALLLARNPNLTVAQVESLLSANADDLGAPGWDPYFGAGRVNALRAVAAAGATLPTPTPAPTATPTPTATPVPTEIPATPTPTEQPTEVAPIPPTPEAETPAPTETPAPLPTAPAPSVHVAELAISYVRHWPRWMAVATVKVADQAGQGVADAAVQMTWGGSYSATALCTTDGAGLCSVASAYLRQKSTSLSLSVDAIQHAALVYDPAANQVALPLSGLMPQSASAPLTAKRTPDAVLVRWPLDAIDPARELALFRAAGDNPDNAQPVEIAPVSGQSWDATGGFIHTDTAVAPDESYTYWLVQLENGEPADELGSISVPASQAFVPVSQVFVPLVSQ